MMGIEFDMLLDALARTAVSVTPDTIARALLVMALLALPLLTWRLARGSGTRVDAAATTPADGVSPRIRQARTFASGGMDADTIARRSRIARDIAALLVTHCRPDEPAGPGTLFRWRPRGGRAG